MKLETIVERLERIERELSASDFSGLCGICGEGPDDDGDAERVLSLVEGLRMDIERHLILSTDAKAVA